MYLFLDNTTIFVTHDQYATGGTDSNSYNTKEATSMPPNIATSTVTSVEPESPNPNDNTIVTSIEPRSSESDNNTFPIIAGVIAGIIVLFGSVIVLVVVFLLMKARYTFN